MRRRARSGQRGNRRHALKSTSWCFQGPLAMTRREERLLGWALSVQAAVHVLLLPPTTD